MPRLEDNPSYKHAAQLAKAGPETWQSWMGALGALKDMFFAATADAPVGSVLRLAGTGVPRTQQSLEQDIEDTILNYGFPGGSNIGGVIKGLKPAIRKAKPGARELRSVMAEEFRARGKTPSQAAGSINKHKNTNNKTQNYLIVGGHNGNQAA